MTANWENLVKRISITFRNGEGIHYTVQLSELLDNISGMSALEVWAYNISYMSYISYMSVENNDGKVLVWRAIYCSGSFAIFQVGCLLFPWWPHFELFTMKSFNWIGRLHQIQAINTNTSNAGNTAGDREEE